MRTWRPFRGDGAHTKDQRDEWRCQRSDLPWTSSKFQSEEIESLAQAYLKAAVVTPNFVDDALHVAMASVHGMRRGL